MLGVECSLPATVWKAAGRILGEGEAVQRGATVRGLPRSEYL